MYGSFFIEAGVLEAIKEKGVQLKNGVIFLKDD